MNTSTCESAREEYDGEQSNREGGGAESPYPPHAPADKSRQPELSLHRHELADARQRLDAVVDRHRRHRNRPWRFLARCILNRGRDGIQYPVSGDPNRHHQRRVAERLLSIRGPRLIQSRHCKLEPKTVEVAATGEHEARLVLKRTMGVTANLQRLWRRANAWEFGGMRATCMVGLLSFSMMSCERASAPHTVGTSVPLSFAPSPGGAPSPPTGAAALEIGTIVTGTITSNEPFCAYDLMDFGGTCRIYTITIPRDGTLTASAKWQDPHHVMTLSIIPPGWNGGVTSHPPPDSSGSLFGNEFSVHFYHAVAGSTGAA